MGRLCRLSKRNWHQQLERPQRELKEYTYRPLPVRQHRIPNRDNLSPKIACVNPFNTAKS